MQVRALIVALVTIALASLSGCSRATTLFVFNNTDQPVELLLVTSQRDLEHAPRDRGIANRDITLEPHQGRDTGVTFSFDSRGWRVEARSGECRLIYSVPPGHMIPNYPWDPAHINPYVKIQIESDFSVHLVPESATSVVDVALYREQQTGGFPLRPVENSCAT